VSEYTADSGHIQGDYCADSINSNSSLSIPD